MSGDEARLMCSFWVRPFLFGVDVDAVQEVVTDLPITRVPLAPPYVSGVINLRGQIVPAVDLRRRLELGEEERGDEAYHVVVSLEDGIVSFVVDDVEDVTEVDAERFERPPETLHGAARELIEGAFKMPERLLLVLDPKKLADVGANGS
jgi:purine-binding chemotaxis protein CheW